jgi:hypothetical protein
MTSISDDNMARMFERQTAEFDSRSAAARKRGLDIWYICFIPSKSISVLGIDVRLWRDPLMCTGLRRQVVLLQ